MRNILLIVSIISVAFVSVSFIKPVEKKTFSLTVKVKDLRNSKGVVQFSIYNKDGTIPDEKFEKYYRQKKAQITKGSSFVVFDNLPIGKYAINILHDENKNSKVDKGWILPIEGLGFSNFKSIGMTNRPNFKKASFNLVSNVTKTINVIYM